MSFELRAIYLHANGVHVQSLPLDAAAPGDGYAANGFGLYQRVGATGELQWVEDFTDINDAAEALAKHTPVEPPVEVFYLVAWQPTGAKLRFLRKTGYTNSWSAATHYATKAKAHDAAKDSGALNYWIERVTRER